MVQDSSTSPNQQRRPLPSLMALSFFYKDYIVYKHVASYYAFAAVLTLLLGFYKELSAVVILNIFPKYRKLKQKSNKIEIKHIFKVK